MNETGAITPQIPMSESTFYMLRCVVAVACADNVIKEQELLFLRALLSHFKHHMIVSPEQVAQLKEDLKTHQNIEYLLPHVTNPTDREQLILYAGLLAQSDGEVHPSEEVVLRKINSFCGGPAPAATTDAAHPAGAPASHAVAVPVPMGGGGAPPVDMNAFMQEVRDVVRQEVYQQAMKTSGVDSKTHPVAIIDAMAEKGRVVPHTDSYHVVAQEPKLGKDMRHNMVEGERLLGKAHFHYIFWVYTLILAGLLMGFARPVGRVLTQAAGYAQQYIFSDAGAWLGPGNIETLGKILANPAWAHWPALVMYVAAVLFVLWRIAVYHTTEIVVTDSRMVVKQGIFIIRTFKCDMANLGQVDVNQSLLGSWLGYGSIHVYTRNWQGHGNAVEAEGIYLPPIADPHSFSTLVDRARRMWRTRSV